MVTTEYVDFLSMWNCAPEYSLSLPPIIDCELEPHLENLLLNFEKPPKLLDLASDSYDRKYIRQLANSGFDENIRMHMWLHILGFTDIRQYVQRYHNLYPEFIMKWGDLEENLHNSKFETKLRGIQKDLARTFAPDGESLNKEKQMALRNVLGVYALADEEISYVQGMNMLVYHILEVCNGSEDIAFAIFAKLMKLNDRGCKLPRGQIEMEKHTKINSEGMVDLVNYPYCAGGQNSKNGVEGYGLRFMFTNCLPNCIISLIVFDELVFELLPHVHEILQMHNITPQLFASEWFFTLFTYVIKEEEVLHRIWDLFLVDGYKALFRVAVAILSRSYERIVDVEYEVALNFLKRFPDRTVFIDENDEKPGDSLIREAMSFKITNRGLSHLATSILEDGRFSQHAI